jgi:hypothetical protein
VIWENGFGGVEKIEKLDIKKGMINKITKDESHKRKTEEVKFLRKCKNIKKPTKKDDSNIRTKLYVWLFSF